MKKTKHLPLLFITLTMVACSSSECRRKKNIPPFDDVIKKAISKDLKISTPHHKDRDQTIFIYKYDGSLQCGHGKPIPLDTMAHELEGIQILSKENRPDGLIHSQACGTITGQANVYEIWKKDLSKAKARGFNLWQLN